MGLSFHGLIKTSDRRKDPRLASGADFHNHSTLPGEWRPPPEARRVSMDQPPGLSTHECGQNLAKDVVSFQESRGKRSREGETTRDPLSRLTT